MPQRVKAFSWFGPGAPSRTAERQHDRTVAQGYMEASDAFVGDPASSPDAGERWDGFVAAHLDRGLPAPARPV